MASGSNNLTSYKAKQIIGSGIAASPSGALLLTGEHYTGNTWLYHYGYGGTTNPWGIFHDTTAAKLIIRGNGTDSFWIKMDTGDTYVLGKVGIGYDPNTTGNNYKLYVNGSAYFNIGTDSTSDLDFVINGSNAYLSFSGQGIKSFTSADANNTLFLNYNGGQTQIGGSGYLVGSVGIGYDPDTSGNTYKLYVNGSSYFTDMIYLPQGFKTGERVSGSGAGIEIGTDGGIEIFHSSTPFIDFHYQASTSDYSVRLICDSATNLGCKGSFTATSDIYANGGYLKSTKNSNTVTIGSQNTSFTHIYNSANIPFIFNKDVLVTDTKNLGSTSWPWGNLYIGTADGAGIYYVTSNYTKEVIRFLNHSADQYGVGLKICTGGLIIIGAGESGDTIQTNLAPVSGSEVLYLASDGNIAFYPGQNSYDAAALISMSAGSIWAGVNGNTTRENQVGVQSGAGQMYMWAAASTSGSRGIWLPAHGSGGAKAVFSVDTNNAVTFNGTLNGNAATASSVAWSGVSSKPATATRWPAWNEISQSGADSLNEGTSNWTDNTEILTSYASNNGFADSNAKGVVYRRDAICAYNYIKSKASGSWGISVTGSAGSVAWANTGHPSTFPPSSHTHDISQISWAAGSNLTCSGANTEWSIDMASSATGSYWHVWSAIKGGSCIQCYNDDRRVNVPVRLDTPWLRVVNNSSNNSDDAMVYLENKSSSDWAVKINCSGANYGLQVTTLDNASDAIQTNGIVVGHRFWANRGTTNSERQLGVDNSNAGSLYAYSSTSGKGINSGSGYKANTSILAIPSDGKIYIRYNTLINDSSRLIKKDIRPITNLDAKKLLYVNPIFFHYKEEFSSSKSTEVGMIAEEVETVIPEAVIVPEGARSDKIVYNERGEALIKGIDYTKFIPYLIKLAQIQQKEIDTLRKQVNELCKT